MQFFFCYLSRRLKSLKKQCCSFQPHKCVQFTWTTSKGSETMSSPPFRMDGELNGLNDSNHWHRPINITADGWFVCCNHLFPHSKPQQIQFTHFSVSFVHKLTVCKLSLWCRSLWQANPSNVGKLSFYTRNNSLNQCENMQMNFHCMFKYPNLWNVCLQMWIW